MIKEAFPVETLKYLPKSLYRSRGGRHFNGTENDIWTSFGPVGNTEKQIWG